MRPPTAKEMSELTTTTMTMLEMVLGEKLTKRTVATMSDGAAWLRAPQTTLETLKEIFDQAGPVDERRLERFAEQKLAKFDDVVKRSVATHPILRGRTPSSLMNFLVLNSTSIDFARIEGLALQGMLDVLIPAQVVPLTVIDRSNLFEPTIFEAGRYLRDAIEGWYKPLLKFLVELTCSARQCALPSKLGPRSTLGSWIGAAQTLWASTNGPTGVLDQRLLAFRNFFSHEKPQLNLRAETLASPFGDGRSLDREAFAAVLHASYFKLSAMWLVLNTWVHRNNANVTG